jgi:hypothetical protein
MQQNDVFNFLIHKNKTIMKKIIVIHFDRLTNEAHYQL